MTIRKRSSIWQQCLLCNLNNISKLFQMVRRMAFALIRYFINIISLHKVFYVNCIKSTECSCTIEKVFMSWGKFVLVNSFIYSNFNYCPVVWMFSNKKSIRIQWRLIFAIAIHCYRLRIWAGYFVCSLLMDVL